MHTTVGPERVDLRRFQGVPEKYHRRYRARHAREKSGPGGTKDFGVELLEAAGALGTAITGPLVRPIGMTTWAGMVVLIAGGLPTW